MNNNLKQDSKEGEVAKTIENVTSKIPSDIYLWAAVAAMSTSLCLKLMRKSHASLFFGQWVSPFMLMGIYNKIVKTEGHDKHDQ